MIDPDEPPLCRDELATACLRLWAAVLILAVRDYKDGRLAHRKADPIPGDISHRFDTAQRWLAGAHSRLICELLNVDHRTIFPKLDAFSGYPRIGPPRKLRRGKNGRKPRFMEES